MKSVNMHQAKSNLSGLVRDLLKGSEREVVICIAGRPAAKLVPIGESPRRQLGVDRGLISIASDFDDVNSVITSLFEE